MAVVLVATACSASTDGGDDVTSTSVVDTSSTTTTTAPPSTTTTSTLPETTTTSVPATPLEELGYPVSDDWVVETVVAGVDAGTGGLAIDADGVFYQGDFGYTGHVGDLSLIHI